MALDNILGSLVRESFMGMGKPWLMPNCFWRRAMKSSSASAGREGGRDKSQRPGWLKESMTLGGGSTDGADDTADDEEEREKRGRGGEDGGKRKTDVMGDVDKCLQSKIARSVSRLG